MGKASRNRVYQDRLWDDQGREWTTTLGRWATSDEVANRLAVDPVVVVHGFGRAFETLGAAEAHRFWSSAKHHFQVPGQDGAIRDGNGLTYAAQVWSRGPERLLAFVVFC